tara:strand:- start:283 stop:498 length:216 start_codon:yes stop_codon:yes gene_type:complete
MKFTKLEKIFSGKSKFIRVSYVTFFRFKRKRHAMKDPESDYWRWADDGLLIFDNGLFDHFIETEKDILNIE